MSAEIEEGTRVVIVSGRRRGDVATIGDIAKVPTPSGSTATVVRLKWPRAADSWAFLSDVRPAEEGRGERVVQASEDFHA